MKNTLDEFLRPLMEVKSIKLPFCAICGRVYPLNQHHIVQRSQGQLYKGSKRLKKPTITLCGCGSVLYGLTPDGTTAKWCHGKAHHKMLHFRNDRGCLEALETEKPTAYLNALQMDGWRDVDEEQYGEWWG